ncbi:MAG: hypothetical protein PVF76_02060, partial [Syntrophobacterales bacterium]
QFSARSTRGAISAGNLDYGSEYLRPLVGGQPETMSLDVILRRKATKNLIVSVAAEILRSAQNDIREFPDEHWLVK